MRSPPGRARRSAAAPSAECRAGPAIARPTGRGTKRRSPVDHTSRPVLVGLPRVRADLIDAPAAPVTDALRESRLQALPLVVREGDRVVVELPERLERALVDVGLYALAGD